MLISPSKQKQISFGKNGTPQRLTDVITGGETYVVTRNNFYFQEFKPLKILGDKFESIKEKTKNDNTKSKKNSSKNKIRRYFLPFRQINQISNNTNDIRYSGGCQIITAVTQKTFNVLKELTLLEPNKRANFWLPGILGIKETGELKIHGKNNQYHSLSDRIKPSSNYLKNIVDTLLFRINDKKTADLVIAIGNSWNDLNFIDPFRRLDLDSANPESFKIIKDLPFRSAFICDKRTPEALKDTVKKLAQKCNADGNLRFAVIDASETFLTNKIAHAILLLQKSYANYSKEFRKNISQNLKTLLKYKELEYANIDMTPKWVTKDKKEKIPFIKSLKNFLLNNKCTTGLILTSIIAPIYFKNFYSENKKN